MSLTEEEKALIGTAFDWLEVYMTQCGVADASRPAPQGTLYEAWCTLTLVYMPHGFSRSSYPLNQIEQLPDFIGVSAPCSGVSRRARAWRLLTGVRTRRRPFGVIDKVVVAHKTAITGGCVN